MSGEQDFWLQLVTASVSVISGDLEVFHGKTLKPFGILRCEAHNDGYTFHKDLRG